MKKLLFTILLASTAIASQAQVSEMFDVTPNTTRKHREKASKEEKPQTDYIEHIPTKDMMAKLNASSFTDTSGKEFKISDVKKKIIILEFWESWCKPCVASMGILDQIQKENDSTVQVIAVNSLMKDNDEAFKKYIAKNKYQNIHFAKLKNLIKEMDVHSVPFKMFLDENGACIAAYEGVSENRETEYNYIKEKITTATKK